MCNLNGFDDLPQCDAVVIFWDFSFPGIFLFQGSRLAPAALSVESCLTTFSWWQTSPFLNQGIKGIKESKLKLLYCTFTIVVNLKISKIID